ncbi:MAG: PEP-CTERM sorting domain-containing protein [Rhizobiaceae bacterium]
MKLRSILLASAIAIATASSASATIMSVFETAGNSTAGTAAAIIAAPKFATDAAFTNSGQQGFNELQSVLLTADLLVDGGIIAKGTRVNSHMIFLNLKHGETSPLRHLGVEWTFKNRILGTMSDYSGNLEFASTPILGWPGTTYQSPYNARGLEGSDAISFFGNVLTLSMNVSQPGDWIRVVSAVPVPPALPLFGTALAVLGFMGWRRKQRSA